MTRLCSRQFVWAFLFFLFFLPQVCQANPIVIDPFEIGLISLSFLFFDALIDLVVLTIGFALVRELSCLGLSDFPMYFLAVVVGGLLIDLGVFVVPEEQSAFGILLASLAGYNLFLCWVYFKLSLLKAACVGLMIGIFTNPILWADLLPF